jgi:hypothetical protein
MSTVVNTSTVLTIIASSIIPPGTPNPTAYVRPLWARHALPAAVTFDHNIGY